jgi:hypothetical protein
VEQNQKNQHEIWGVFLPVGIGLGTGIGALLGNIGVGIGIGAVLGTTLSLLAYYREQNR